MLDGLADEGGDTPEAHEASDQLRVAYDGMYADAEAFAHSTTSPQRRTARRRGPPPGSRPQPRAPPGRGADLVPHAVRAVVPEGARRTLRKALGRER